MYQFLRQAQEVIGISAEYDNDPLREEINKLCAGDIVMGRNPTVFHDEKIQRNEAYSGFRQS